MARVSSAAATALLIASAIGASSAATTYTNPVLGLDCPDPAVVRGIDKLFYVYCTSGNGHRFQVSASPDLVAWSAPAEAMPVLPAWAPTKGINSWAPHVLVSGATYFMFFALNQASNNSMCIGVATSTSPTGPFADAIGAPLVCGAGFSTIDPNVLTVNGTSHLYWGSDGEESHYFRCASPP